MKKYYKIKMSNGKQYKIPVAVIANDRAKYYAKEFDGDLEKSLNEDTIPLFESDEYEIEDWAKNNMNWHEVLPHAIRIYESDSYDYESGWINAEVEYTD